MTAAIWPSALVAALFALHPIHIESVAWVAERKDVLSTFFWMLTMWAYVWYVERPGFKRYLLVLLAFALGLMAKPMLVTLPFVLLLLDYWPLNRFSLTPEIPKKSKKTIKPASLWRRDLIRHLVLEKVPLFALAVASSIITLHAQKAAIQSIENLSIFERFANALVSYVSYVGKMVWPLHLAVFYPYTRYDLFSWQSVAAALVLVIVSILVMRQARSHPYLPVGWFWYLGTLVPVIGLVQVSDQAMADRYTYVPLVGLFIIVAYGAFDLTAKWRRQEILLALGSGIMLSTFAILTWLQTGYWRNSDSLFEHAAEVTENNYMAYSILIEKYDRQGGIDKAIDMGQKAIKIKPDYAYAYNGLGRVYANHGQFDEAILMFQKAIQLRQYFTDAYNNLGIEYARLGRNREALAMLKKVIQLSPNSSVAFNNLGLAFERQGDVAEAIAMSQKAVQIDPHNTGAQEMLDFLKSQKVHD